MQFRANYATVDVGAHFGPEGRKLDLEWADDAGDGTDPFEFEVSAADTRDAYVGLQAFDVGQYGHEILVNDRPLGGFDIPPNQGWQYWVDTLSEVELRRGTNTVAIVRDTDTRDAFAVGTLTVHWREPVESTEHV